MVIALGENPRHRLEIPFGYCVVYTEEQQNIGGHLHWVRHISISVDTEGKMPNMYGVLMIMKYFGYKADEITDPSLFIYIEHGKAINILQKIGD
jgi:hypothetical protein